MVEIIASISTQMLSDIAFQDEDSYWVIEMADEVMKLLSVLRVIEQLLKNAHNSERILNHIQTIRRLAYRIEDVLETCAAKVAFLFHKSDDERCIKRLVRRYFGVLKLNDGMPLKNIRDMISDVEPEMEILRQVFPDDNSMEIIRVGEEPRVVDLDRSMRWPRQIYPRGTEEHFVGMEEEVQQLIALAVDEEEQTHRVVCIWGAKGLGKTTLATRVYHHPQVRRRFEGFAWVRVSRDCQMRILLQNILRQLGPGKVKEIAEEQDMIEQVKEIQRRKTCLIVVDSIWEIDQWKHISCAFQMEGTDTRLLLTTREENIARVVGFPVKLRLLDEDEGWELLKKHAFPREKAPAFGMLPRLGKEMVHKCGYLPLAISSLGRNLSKISLSEWHMVNNDVTGYLPREYQTEADGRLIDILGSSYDQLSYYVKQCFLYLGMFREEEDIDSDDLIFLWMAEGMVSSEGKRKKGARIMDTAEGEEKEATTMDTSEREEREARIMDTTEEEATIMETAEDYLRELAFSGLLQVQVDELSATRRYKLFCLHNRARELSLYQGEKEDFRLKVVDFCDGKQPALDSSTLSDGTRRLVIRFNKQVNLWICDLVATDHLRSLLFLNSNQKCVDIPVRISDFVKFKLLRVLHFVRCKFEGRKLPKGIDKLVNLRYLGLLYCDLDELPPSISNLRNLHVLNVRAYGNAQITIPNVLSQMIRLKHLRLPDYSEREQTNKLILRNLLELETLVGFNSLIHDVSSLFNLKKLRHLVTHAYSNDSLISILRLVMFYGARMQTDLSIENKCDFSSAEGLAILEEVLMCPNLHALTLSMVLICKFPDCGMHVSSDITQIKLIGCKLKEDPMEALAKFLNLRKLCLGYGAFVGRELSIHDRGFLNLEYLEFCSLPNLEEWRVDDGAMCNLSALTVRRCPELKKIPDGLRSISSLKNLEMELAPRALAEGREAEYRDKFAFVNSFIIRELDLFSAQ